MFSKKIILAFILPSFLSIFFSSCIKPKIEKQIPKAIKGVIDLREIDFSSPFSDSIQLDGEWAFFWNEFIDPKTSDWENKVNSYIQVPSQWQNQKDPSGNFYPAYGYASYVLKVILPEKHPNLYFSMSDTGMAYSLFVNGSLRASNGKVGKSADEMFVRQQYIIFPAIKTTDTELIIVIHNSNFHYYKAGVWQSVVLGEAKTIHEREFHSIAIDLIVISALLIMGLYHIGFFFNRRKDISPFYFGLFCILVVLRTIAIKERLIYEIWSDIPFMIVHKIEYFSFYYGSLVFLQFIHSIFPEDTNPRIYKVFKTIFILCSILVLVSTMSIYTRTLIFVQLTILVGIVYTLKIIFYAIRNKHVGAKSFLAGLLIFFVTIIHDILRTRGVVYSPFLASYGLLFFVVSQAIVLSRRFANAFVLSEALTEELQILSSQLEAKVNERTKELNLALKSIQQDLFYAKRIQNNSLVIDYSEIKDLEIVPYYSAMVEVGGDFYGISSPVKDKYRVFLADVTGHGIQAALITMAVKGIYDNIKNFDLAPSHALDIFNNEFLEKYQSLNSLLTCIFLDIDPKNSKIQYASAGHPSCILLSNGKIELLEKTGRMVGITKNNKYNDLEKEFHKGDRLYLFSDGIYEQFNSSLEEFGEERLYSLIKDTRDLPLKDSIQKIIAYLTEFLGTTKIQDDSTIIGIESTNSN